jgi:hypothetical protein
MLTDGEKRQRERGVTLWLQSLDRTRTTRADSSFLLRYAFPKNMFTNTRTCFLS